MSTIIQNKVVFNQYQCDDVAFVVLSCDKYADLWPIFFETFFDHWSDCPFQIYLVANQKKYEHPKVVTLLSGDDLDWSSSIRKAILQLKESYVFFFYEDALLNVKVSNDELESKVKFFFEHDLDYLRLRPSPLPDERYNNLYGRITEGSIYRVSLFASIWKKAMLLDLLKDGENAWEFEMQGTRRSEKYRKFYATYQPFFSCLHGVEKGKWINATYKELLRQGYKLELTRDFLYKNRLEEILNTLKSWFVWRFINLFPASKQRQVIQLGGNIKRKIFCIKRILNNKVSRGA